MKKEKLALISTILGAMALLIACLNSMRTLSLLLALLGFVCGILYLSQKTVSQKPLAVIGLILSIVSIPMAYLMGDVYHQEKHQVIQSQTNQDEGNKESSSQEEMTELTFKDINFSVPSTWKRATLNSNEKIISFYPEEGSLFLVSVNSRDNISLENTEIRKDFIEGFENNTTDVIETSESKMMVNGHPAFSWDIIMNVKGKKEGKLVSLAHNDLLITFVLATSKSFDKEYSKIFENIISSVKLPDKNETGLLTSPSSVTTNGSSESNQVFSPQDVSDETIESIQTYGDYLTMYQKILDDYMAQYENAIKGTVLYDETTFQMMRKQYEQGFEEQRKQYNKIKDMKIVGKSDLIQFLKNYRDGLKEFVENFSNALQ